MSETALSTRRNIVSRLWSNNRARSIIFQTIAFSAIFLFFFYTIRNAILNLDALGKDISLDFLTQPSSYDISQSLIEYNSQSTHFRAMIVGILNTVLIAVFGIISSTVLGFLLGICRLSKNWLTNKLAYVYIEYTRNVPVLLHILLIHGMIVNSLPLPKNAVNMFDIMFCMNRGFFTPRPHLESLFLVIIVLFILGVFFSFWFIKYAKQVQNNTGRYYPVFWICTGVTFGIPLIVYFLIGSPITWEIPKFKGFNYQGGWVIRPEFVALWIALSGYTAAFIGEIVRSGITAVNYGQIEVASALGISRMRTLRLVVIPQALRIIIPPLTSQYLNLTKNSSLAIAIGYMDIVATIGGISLNQTGREMECMMIVLFLYLSFSLLISVVMNFYNKRVNVHS